jgi:alcohol dehydrogenase class IV
MSQGIALEGMRLVKEYLPRAYADGGDIEARSHMMSAAAMGATAFMKGLGAIHAISHPVGAVFNTHHGTTNAICMPPVLDFNADAIRERFDLASAYLGIAGGFDGFRAFVQEFNDSFGIPRTLSEVRSDRRSGGDGGSGSELRRQSGPARRGQPPRSAGHLHRGVILTDRLDAVGPGQRVAAGK